MFLTYFLVRIIADLQLYYLDSNVLFLSLYSSMHFSVYLLDRVTWVIICQISFWRACTVSPGRITIENNQYYKHQQFDCLMFPSKIVSCKTCLTPKLARSKHCGLCGHCVPLFDHHCIWMNQVCCGI